MDNFSGYVIATKLLVENKRKVRFMYREQPLSEHDSGWRFSCGTETPEYYGDPANSALYNISTIIEIDPSIQPYLNADINTAFGRDSDNDAFQVLDDFEFSHYPELLKADEAHKISQQIEL